MENEKNEKRSIESLVDDAKNLKPESTNSSLTPLESNYEISELPKTDPLTLHESPDQVAVEDIEKTIETVEDINDMDDVVERVIKKEKIIKKAATSPMRRKKYVKLNRKIIKSNPRQFF